MSAGAAGGRTVRFESIGCRVNQAESVGLEAALVHRGFRSTRDENPDIIVINTCAVTANADTDGRKLLRRLHRRHPSAALVVTGCQAERDGIMLGELPGVRLLVTNAAKHRIPELVHALVQGEPAAERSVAETSTGADRPFPEIEFAARNSAGAGPSRVLVKIQDGCDRSCTFCVIPGTRGGSVSRSPEKIVEELAHIGNGGVAEAVLTGIDLGSWGQDLDVSTSLAALLDRLDRQRPLTRVRLSSLDPRDLDDALAERIANYEWICPHLHVSLQTASPAVHRRMGRGPFPEGLAARLEAIRTARPELALGLDLMTAFPGESDEDHERTLAWVREAPMTYLHVFPFSERAGTASEGLRATRVAADLRQRRARELRDLGDRARLAFHQRHLGRTVEAVAERHEGGHWMGITANFIRTEWAGPETPSQRDQLVRLRVVEAGPERCRGELA